jgi:hypothetical protein
MMRKQELFTHHFYSGGGCARALAVSVSLHQKVKITDS